MLLWDSCKSTRLLDPVYCYSSLVLIDGQLVRSRAVREGRMARAIYSSTQEEVINDTEK